MKMLFRLTACTVLAAGLLTVLPQAAQAAPSTPDFVKNAAIGNNFEITSSRLALQKSQNPQIKQFAQQMIDDHSKVASQLTSLTSADSSLPQPPAMLDNKHQKMVDKLSKETGGDFDKDYVSDQTRAHKEAVSLFKGYAKGGDNQALQSFASTNLPTLQEHESEVKQLKSSI